jgi:gliding motility-associated-like protein
VKNRLLSALMLLVLLVGLNAHSQSVITPATDGCTCNGSISYTSPSNVPTSFQVTDAEGNVVSTINSADGTFSFGNLCAEPYQVAVTQGGNTSTFVFNVSVVGLNPGNSKKLTVCSSDGNVNLNTQLVGFQAGGSWQNPDGQSVPNILSPENALSGWYTYTYIFNACPVITGVLLNRIQNANPGMTTTYLICDNYEPFLMTTVMQNSPDPGGQWYYASNNQPMNGIYDPATMNSQQFYYTVPGVAGCPSATAFLTVQENHMPNPGQNASITVCSYSAPINLVNHLGGTPLTNGTWYSPTMQPIGNMFSPAIQPSGNYTYIVAAQDPCSPSQSVLAITVVDETPSGENATQTVCTTEAPFNMTNELNGFPLAGGTWRNSANQVVSEIFNPASGASGAYTYFYPSVGCTSQQATLSITTVNAVSAGADNALSVCESQGTLNLNALLSANAGTNGIWTNNANQPIAPTITLVASNNPQLFTYTVENTACADDQAVMQVTVNTAVPQLADTSFTICSSASVVDLGNYFGNNSQVVFTNSAGNSISNLFDPSTQTSGMYHAALPANGACPGNAAQVSITVETPAFNSGSVDVVACEADSPYDLFLSNPALVLGSGEWHNATGQVISSLVELNFTGIRTFTFHDTVATVCTSSQWQVNLSSSTAGNAGADQQLAYCNVDGAQALMTVANNGGDAGGQWYFNGSSWSGTFQPATDQSGTYLYVIPSSGSCPADTSMWQIDVQYGINYDAGQDVTQCFGSAPVTLGQSGLSGAVYQWSPATNLSATNVAQPQVFFYQQGNQPISVTYTVQVQQGVCSSQDQVTVTTLPKPQSDLPNEYQICRGESVSLSVPGNNLTCHWMPIALFDNSTAQYQLISPDFTIEVEVQIMNEYNCVSLDSTLITVHQLPVVSFTPIAIPGCAPLSVSYNYQPLAGESVLWNIPGAGSFVGNQFQTTLWNEGKYNLTLSVTSSFGCVNTVQYSQIMEVYPGPVAMFDKTPEKLTTINPTAVFINQSIDAESYFWEFDQLGTSTLEHPEFTFPNTEANYFEACLEATNLFGCKDTACVVLPMERDYLFYAPNAFTPNDDGINDGFKPVMEGFVNGTYTFRVFNRWGDEIFMTRNINDAWMGDANSGDYYVPDGVYHWRVEVQPERMKDFEVFEGHVVVMR